MSRLFSRLLILAALSALAIFLLSCGSSSPSGTGGGSGSGGGGGTGGGGSNAIGGFAAGIGGAGQTNSAHFLIAIMVPGVTPFPTTVNPGGTLTKASVTMGPYSVFNPMGMDAAIDPSGSFLYQAGEPGLWAFTINRQNGNLTEMANSPYDSTVNFETVTIDQSGKFVYAFAAAQVYGYSIQPGTGQLTPVTGSPFAAAPSDLPFAAPIDRIAVSQDDNYLYVGASTGIFAYSINPSSGALTPVPGSPFGGTAGGVGAILTPASGFLYALPMKTFADGIYGYSINSSTGALTALSGSPFAGTCNTGGTSNLTSPASGKLLFASCGMFQIDANTGALNFVTANPAAPSSGWAVFDPPGDLLWITVSQEPCFDCNEGPEAFQVDATTGTLTPVQNSFFQITNSQVGGIQALAITQ